MPALLASRRVLLKRLPGLNHVTNHGFEVDTTGWSNIATGSLARITTDAYRDSACGEVTTIAQNDGASFAGSGNAIQGVAYELSAYVKAKAGGDIGKVMQLLIQTSGGTFELFSALSARTSGDLLLTNYWQLVTRKFTWQNPAHTGWTLVVRAIDATPGSFLVDQVTYRRV